MDVFFTFRDQAIVDIEMPPCPVARMWLQFQVIPLTSYVFLSLFPPSPLNFNHAGRNKRLRLHFNKLGYQIYGKEHSRQVLLRPTALSAEISAIRFRQELHRR